MNEIKVKSSKRIVVNGHTINIASKDGMGKLLHICSIEELKAISEELGNATYNIVWVWNIYTNKWRATSFTEEEPWVEAKAYDASLVVRGPLGTLPNPIVIQQIEDRMIELRAGAILTPGISMTVVSMDELKGIVVEAGGHLIRLKADTNKEDGSSYLKVSFAD